MMKPNLSRRNFLTSAGTGLALLLSGCVIPLGVKTNPFVNPQRLAEVFRNKGVEPKVFPSGGNRTLLAVGETHLDYGSVYNRFFSDARNSKTPEIDTIFLENVYSPDYVGKDPYFDCVFGGVLNESTNEDREEFAEDDPCGFYEMRQHGFKVIGIENLCDGTDTRVSGYLLSPTLRLYDFSDKRKKVVDKEPEQETRILEKMAFLVGNSRPNFPKNFPNKVSWEQGESYFTEALRFEDEVSMRRHLNFFEYLKKNMKPEEVGSLIIGDGHLNGKEKYGFGDRESSLPLLLSGAGINVVYIHVKDLIRYLINTGVPENELNIPKNPFQRK